MLKLKMMLCVMMLPLVVVGCTSKQSVSQWSHHCPADNAASPDWQTTAERDYFTLRERPGSLCKNNWKEPRSILMSSADRVAHIDGQPTAIIVSNTHALPAEYKCLKSNKTEQSIYECLLGFCFNNIFCAATNFGLHRQFSSAQFQKRRNDGWWFPFWCYCRRFVWTVNVCWVHPVISRASAEVSSIFFMVLSLTLFEVRRIVCVEN